MRGHLHAGRGEEPLVCEKEFADVLRKGWRDLRAAQRMPTSPCKNTAPRVCRLWTVPDYSMKWPAICPIKKKNVVKHTCILLTPPRETHRVQNRNLQIRNGDINEKSQSAGLAWRYWVSSLCKPFPLGNWLRRWARASVIPWKGGCTLLTAAGRWHPSRQRRPEREMTTSITLIFCVVILAHHSYFKCFFDGGLAHWRHISVMLVPSDSE